MRVNQPKGVREGVTQCGVRELFGGSIPSMDPEHRSQEKERGRGCASEHNVSEVIEMTHKEESETLCRATTDKRDMRHTRRDFKVCGRNGGDWLSC